MTIEPTGLGVGTILSTEEGRSGGSSFAKAITEYLKDVNQDQLTAAGQVKSLLVNGEGSIHDAMVAMSTAEGSLRLLMEMRNRLVDGVNRLLQTQV